MMKLNLKSQWYIWMMLPLMGYLASCGNDDDDTPAAPALPESYVTINGQTYELTNGYYQDYGSNDPLPSFDVDIFFTDKPYDTSTFSFNPETSVYVYLDLNTTEEGVIVPGTYTYNDERSAGSISFAEVITEVVFDEDGFIDYDKSKVLFGTSEATAKVSVTGSEYLIEFSIKLSDGSTATGVYKGMMRLT